MSATSGAASGPAAGASSRPGADVATPWLATLPRAGVAAFTGLVAVVTVSAAVGVLPRWPGLVHLVALPPLDLAADLRLALARAPSYPVFLAGLGLSLAVRITVLALLLGGPRAPRWRLATGLYAAALLPALLAAQVDFVARTALYSRAFGASLAVLAVLVLVLGAAPWTGADQLGAALRRSVASGLRVADLAAYLVLLLALGTVAEWLGTAWAAVVAVPVSGLLTLLAARRLSAAGPLRPWRYLLVTVAVGVAIAALVVVSRGTPWMTSDAERDGAALIMSGINSASGEGAIFELEPERVGYVCEQMFYYSYAGTGDGQPQGDAACPIRTGAPYDPEDTQRPFDEQVELLAAQADRLPEPVVVFAHSQAAWVAWEAAAAGVLPQDTSLVLVGPFPSSPTGFPPPDDVGPGRVGGELFRLLEPVPELVDFDFEVDAPLTHELLARPDAASEVFSRSLPEDVEALAVTASSDLALMPDGWRIEQATNVCPVREAHPYLPITPAFHHAADRFLDGDRGQEACPPWPELYRLATQALGAPPHDA